MTSNHPFGKVPVGAQQQPSPFELHIEEQKLQDFKTLLRLSPIAKQTYENEQDAGSHGRFGVSRQWIANAKKHWEEEYDWRETESHINSFPNFTTQIADPDNKSDTFTIHFTALFSSKPDAIPIAFFHGWPGSFLEFLPIMSLLSQKYTPDTLPYHIIVPSLPGFGLSSPPPLTRDSKVPDTARIMHTFLLSLGFTSYLVQGGDIGSHISRSITATYAECKGMHLNFMLLPNIQAKSTADDNLTDQEQRGVQRLKDFLATEHAYAEMHGTKPSTIGLVLASSPLAHLAWIGEKFLAWSDPRYTPSLDTILADITLYWFTGCFASSIYTYRDEKDAAYVDKPVGYSYFPYELAPVPKAWAEKTGRLTFYRAHEAGGHFAALERAELLWEDVEEWIGTAWK